MNPWQNVNVPSFGTIPSESLGAHARKRSRTKPLLGEGIWNSIKVCIHDVYTWRISDPRPTTHAPPTQIRHSRSIWVNLPLGGWDGLLLWLIFCSAFKDSRTIFLLVSAIPYLKVTIGCKFSYLLNRPFPSSRLPPLQSESKCEVFFMKISFHSYGK